MSVGSFGYLFKEGFKNVWVNRLMSFASIGTLMACMLLIGGSLLLSLNVNSVIGDMEKQNEAVVYTDDDITEEEIRQLDTQISMIDNVFDVMFISKDQLLQETKARTDELAQAMEGLPIEEDNPLPNTFRLSLRDQSLAAETKTQLETLDNVAQVYIQLDLAETITSLKQAISVSGYVIVGILVVVSLVIIANTIKVTVFNRRKEINIMKCVGATNAFIRMPFFIEGFLIGLTSALIAFGLLWAGYDYLMGSISSSNTGWIKTAYENMLPFKAVAVQMFAYFAAGGIGIGVFGSMFFVNKYLKV